MSKNPLVLTLVALVLLVIGTQGFFTVYQTQRALVLQLGEPLPQVYGPGLHFKIPFIQRKPNWKAYSVIKGQFLSLT